MIDHLLYIQKSIGCLCYLSKVTDLSLPVIEDIIIEKLTLEWMDDQSQSKYYKEGNKIP